MDQKELMKPVNGLFVTALLTLIVIVVLGVVLTSCGEASRAETSQALALAREEQIKRGAYLVNTVGCHDCHSPKVMTPNGPEPDPTRLLSGYPEELPLPPMNKDALANWVLFNQELTSAAGPWGVSFAANLTSDETGIGNWTEDQFLTAIKNGKYKGLEGSRSLLPPMPWPMYKNMTDDDLRAIFAYLKTTKAVHNLVPAPIAPEQIK